MLEVANLDAFVGLFLFRGRARFVLHSLASGARVRFVVRKALPADRSFAVFDARPPRPYRRIGMVAPAPISFRADGDGDAGAAFRWLIRHLASDARSLPHARLLVAGRDHPHAALFADPDDPP